MSKYLPLNLSWRFTTWSGFIQWRSLIYRIYINIFGIFLRIPILPLGIDKIGPEFYYRGDTIWWSWKKKKWISSGFSGDGSFGDACYDTLKDLDNNWKEYFNECRKIQEREDKEYKYKVENGLCLDVFCKIDSEHKKHD